MPLLAGKAPIYLQSLCFKCCLEEQSAGPRLGSSSLWVPSVLDSRLLWHLVSCQLLGFARDCPLLGVWKGQEPTFILTWASCSTLSSFDASEWMISASFEKNYLFHCERKKVGWWYWEDKKWLTRDWVKRNAANSSQWSANLMTEACELLSPYGCRKVFCFRVKK